MSVVLRPYQERMLAEARRVAAGGGHPLLVAPTGSGKGTIATEICHGAGRHGSRIVFLVNRKELVKDMSKRLDVLGLDHGIIMADHWRHRPHCHVQIASIDTLHRRAKTPPADILVLDEAHFAVSDVWFKAVERYPDAIRIGMTATPVRLDGKGLGHKGMFTHLVMGPSVRELIDQGSLCPPRVFGWPEGPALDQVEVSKSTRDYNQKQLGQAMKKPKIMGDAVGHWLKLAKGMPTVAFCVDIENSLEFRDRFRRAGITAEHADCDTPSAERDRLWDHLAKGRVQVVCSVGIVSYGWDVPAVQCAILLRPTQSLALYLQQVGRVLRPFPGKDYALVLDHAGNVLRHGPADEDRVWSLSEGLVTKETVEQEEYARMCEKCLLMYPSTLAACPECGHVNAKKKREIEVVDGELQEVVPVNFFKCEACNTKGRLPMGADYTIDCPVCHTGPLRRLGSKYDNGAGDAEKRKKYCDWYLDGVARGYKPTWAAMRFKQIYGVWPPRAWRTEAEKKAMLQELAS